MKNPNLYALGKQILSEGLVVRGWWNHPDWTRDIYKLLRFFGKKALQRGIDESIQKGEVVPPEVQRELDEASLLLKRCA